MPQILKFLISAGLLLLLFAFVDWDDSLNIIAEIEPTWFFLAFMILLAQFPISAWKWQVSLSIHEQDWSVLSLLRIGVIGFFINNFLPTAIGGDIFRAYRTTPVGGRKSTAISAILLDRLIGLIAMFVVATTGAVFLYFRQPDLQMLILVLILASPPLVAASVPTLVRVPAIRGLVNRFYQHPKLEPLRLNARLVICQKAMVWRLFLISILFQSFAVLAIFSLFSSVHVHSVLPESAVIGAASALASLLPISINGIGVIEGSFAMTAKEFGVDFNSAVLVALLLRLSTVFFSIFGAIAFFFDKGRKAGELSPKSR